MKKIIYTGVAAAALLGGSVAVAAPAFAGTGPGSNGQTGQLTGKGATSYVDPVFGPVKCNETQHPRFDTVDCQFTGGQTLTPGSTGTIGWISDFGDRAGQGVLTYTVNTDGTGYSGLANGYPG